MYDSFQISYCDGITNDNIQYGATVFQSVGISDSFVTQIVLGAVNFVCTFGGLYIVEHVSLFLFLLCPRAHIAIN